jgi:hypothetical protein
MKRDNTSVFSKVWKFGKRGCTAREKYLDLPDGIRVPNEEDCVCAQICAFKDTNEVLVYNLHYPDDEVNNWGEFVELHELPMKCLKTILDFINGLGSTKRDCNVLGALEALEELKRKMEWD